MVKIFVREYSRNTKERIYKVALVVYDYEEENIDLIWPCKLVYEEWQADIFISLSKFYAKDADIKIKYNRIPELSPIYGVENKIIIKSSENEKE